MNNPAGTPGGYFPGRRSNRAISAERAIDLCRTEVRTRAEHDYNIRNINITAAAVDATAGRSDGSQVTSATAPGISAVRVVTGLTARWTTTRATCVI